LAYTRPNSKKSGKLPASSLGIKTGFYNNVPLGKLSALFIIEKALDVKQVEKGGLVSFYYKEAGSLCQVLRVHSGAGIFNG